MKRVVPADHDPEDSVPRCDGQKHEQQRVVHMIQAEPPPGEVKDALQTEEEKDSYHPTLRGQHRCGATVAENLTVVGPGRHETPSLGKKMSCSAPRSAPLESVRQLASLPRRT